MMYSSMYIVKHLQSSSVSMLRRIDHVLSFLIFPEASFQFGNAVTTGRENKSKGVSIARRVVIHKPQRSAEDQLNLGVNIRFFHGMVIKNTSQS